MVTYYKCHLSERQKLGILTSKCVSGFRMISEKIRIISLHKIYEKDQVMHCGLINATLLDSDHRHVTGTHAAILRVVSARIQIHLVCRVQSTVKNHIVLVKIPEF